MKQQLLFVGGEEGKMVAIRQLIQNGIKPPVLIFVQSITRAKELFKELIYDNISVDVIHSERTKLQVSIFHLNNKIERKNYHKVQRGQNLGADCD